MSPPKLAADAPILNIRQPVVIDLRPPVGMEAHFSWERRRPAGESLRRTRRRDAGAPRPLHARLGLLHRWIFQKPLLAQTRLNRHARALADADFVFIRVFLHERVQFLQSLDRNGSGLEAVK